MVEKRGLPAVVEDQALAPTGEDRHESRAIVSPAGCQAAILRQIEGLDLGDGSRLDRGMCDRELWGDMCEESTEGMLKAGATVGLRMTSLGIDSARFFDVVQKGGGDADKSALITEHHSMIGNRDGKNGVPLLYEDHEEGGSRSSQNCGLLSDNIPDHGEKREGSSHGEDVWDVVKRRDSSRKVVQPRGCVVQTSQCFAMLKEDREMCRESSEGGRVDEGIGLPFLPNDRAPIKQLHFRDFYGLTSRIAEAQETLERYQQLLREHFSEDDRECMRLACDNLKMLLAREDGYLRQMAKDEWIRFNDRNTKYFYNLVKGRQRRSRICGVFAGDGVLASSNSEIGLVFIAFFTELMGKPFELVD
ncbi:hypothetical protein Dimus_011044 [Dionaea muscipula]